MNNKEKKDLKAAFDSMCYQLVNLHAHWNTLEELFFKSRERVDLFRHTASNFFGIIRNMMIDHIELTLAKFADPSTSKRGSKENLSLEQICNIVAVEDRALCKELRASMARYRKYCGAIETHRNNRIAHFDYSTHMDTKVPGLPAVTTTTIKSAIKELDQFMNKVSEILGEKIETESLRLETEYFFDPVISDNVDALVCFLAFGLRYDELRRAGEIPISDIDESKYWKP